VPQHSWVEATCVCAPRWLREAAAASAAGWCAGDFFHCFRESPRTASEPVVDVQRTGGGISVPLSLLVHTLWVPSGAW